MSEKAVRINVPELDVALPRLPNFLRATNEHIGIMPVEEVGDADLRRIGKAWTEALVEHARARRAARSDKEASP